MYVVKNIALFRFFIFVFTSWGEPLYYMEPDFMMMMMIIIIIIRRKENEEENFGVYHWAKGQVHLKRFP